MATACRPGADAEAAKREEAKLTGLHVIPEYRVFTHRIDMLEDTRERYAQLAEQHAEQYLGVIVQATEDASVACDHLRHQ